MGKASKKERKKKTSIAIQIPITKTQTQKIITTKTLDTQEVINEKAKNQRKEKQQKQKQKQQRKYENHERYQKTHENGNTEWAANSNAADKQNKMATITKTKTTTNIQSIQRKERNNKNNNNNSNYNYYNDAFQKTCKIEAKPSTTSTQLLPYYAVDTLSQQIQYENQRQQQQQQLQQKQLTFTKALMPITHTAIKSAYSKYELLSKCSQNAMLLYSSKNENVSKINCCFRHTINSIKQQQQQRKQQQNTQYNIMNRRMPMKSKSKFQKLLQYIALSKSRFISNYSSSICCSNNNGYGNNYNLDVRSFIYVTLCVLIYCTVLLRASATAATETETEFGAFQTATASKQNLLQQQSSINISKKVVGAKLYDDGKTFENSSFNGNHSNSILLTNATYENATLLMLNLSSTIMHQLHRRDAANVPDDDDDSSYHDDEFDEYDALVKNKSAKGKYIGAPCNEMKCEPTLLHVTCDKETLTCGCEKNYPVQLGLTKGCDKPKKLGEQCFYDVTCMYNDENSLCVQVRHNALCQCASGFHSVSYTKPTRRVFCTPDLKELSSDLPTLLGVTTGIAVLAGLICMVLHLFSKTKYPRHRNFGDANIPPPIMYSSDTGIPLIVQSGRPSSRSSLRSSGSIGSYGNRRSSSGGVIGGGSGSGGSKGILVSTSRTGSRRPSLASVHSTSSSVRSYSMMRFEKETQQKEIRQEMKLRLARLQQQQQMSQNRPQIIIGDALSMLSGRIDHGPSGSGTTAMTAFSRLTMATPSPLTPNSTDELLPVVDETQEYPIKSEMLPITSTKPKPATGLVAAATLTAVQEIATTSTMALAAAAAAAKANVTEHTTESTTDTAGIQTLSKAAISESGAYIGPCSNSSEAL